SIAHPGFARGVPHISRCGGSTKARWFDPGGLFVFGAINSGARRLGWLLCSRVAHTRFILPGSSG
ncbi:MAG: hypothetical protein ACRD99_00890, partial [Nitrososphaera sp.]